MGYLSVLGGARTERVVEKSRFITYVGHTEGAEAARAYLAEIRAEHPLATHVCWAYIADKTGNEQRFSDDGEPQGTAGMPILNVIKAQSLFETTVAVVRYFGGIKLGAGGLVRAYSAAAAEGCEAAERRRYERCTECELCAEYAQADACKRFLAGSGAELVGREYGETARFTVAVETSALPAFREKLADCLNGRVRISEKREYFFPFSLDRREER